MDHDAGSASPHLDEREQGQAADNASLRALVVHEIIREEGEDALRRPTASLTWSAFAAGLSMGFSFLTQAFLHAGLPDSPWGHLVDSFGYSMGFIIVILGRQQLFTESTLTVMLPVLIRRDLRSLRGALQLWGLVLAANLVGAWLFAVLITPDGLFRPEVRAALGELSTIPMQAGFGLTLLRATFAGWLIAMMVWLLPSAQSARLITILLVTYVVALGGLTHIVAGTVDTAYAVLTGSASFGGYVTRFLLPTLIGNTLGGVSLVALLNHAAIAQELQERRLASG